MPVDVIGIDADDTLWHSETVYREVQDRFNALLAPFGDRDQLERRLAAAERRNLGSYGYGAKGFTLSMIETALEVGGNRLPSSVVSELIALGREMMRHPIHPLPGVEDALDSLARRAVLVLITKGDLFHQESKLAASGLGRFFSEVEIVTEKSPSTYRRIFSRYGTGPERALMAGNSVRSDILPALEAGSFAAWIPYPIAWAHEVAEPPHAHPRFRELATLSDLPGWIDAIA